MIKGFYAAVSGMLANANRQQILSHNIANLETPGFKQVLSTVEDFTHTAVVFPAGNITHSNLEYIGQMGLGAMSGPEVTDYTQGGLQTTGNPLDMAVQGDGFFCVRTPVGDRFTRDGRFMRNADGYLVTQQGDAVLDANKQPIQLADGDVGVASDGTLSVNGAQVGKLGLALFQNPRAALVRSEGNNYSAAGAPDGQGIVQVAQGCLEMSNANSTQLMAQLVEVGRSYEAAQQMVQNQDDLLGKTISSLGRIG
jgi:flagellar basal-body rod protein FlgF